jgi:hypothetical protein
MVYVSKNWKTLITLFVAVVLYVAWSTSPVVALAYDPTLPKAWVSESEAQLGDEGGWNDTDGTRGSGLDGIVDSLEFYISKYLVFYLVPKAIEQNQPIGHHGSTVNQDTDRSRTTPSN